MASGQQTEVPGFSAGFQAKEEGSPAGDLPSSVGRIEPTHDGERTEGEMGKPINGKGNASSCPVVVKRTPRCLAVAEGNFDNSRDLKRVLMYMISDLIGERMEVRRANAVSSAAGKVLKAAELEFRYGTPGRQGGRRVLQLTA
jgi:hypothetical protein